MLVVRTAFGNHVLRLRLRVSVKLNFRPYIRRYTSPNENFEYSYPLNLRTVNFDNFWGVKFVLKFNIFMVFFTCEESVPNPHICEKLVSNYHM